ncbi:Nascent polypeptide-associated complex subunit beta [Diplonema papillatum]|nr:Nascent polypeptide-associated complex subunit beta [Diplonema papillatum]
MVGTGMTREKLEKMAEISRVGGVRRKHKAPRKTLSSDDSKLQNGLKKLGVSQIPDIEEVNFIMENGTILHFGSPKVQASIQSNTYVVAGTPETKSMSDMLPNIIDHLGAESMTQLQELKEKMQETKESDKKEEKTEDKA